MCLNLLLEERARLRGRIAQDHLHGDVHPGLTVGPAEHLTHPAFADPFVQFERAEPCSGVIQPPLPPRPARIECS